VLITTPIYGAGVGPQIGFNPGSLIWSSFISDGGYPGYPGSLAVGAGGDVFVADYNFVLDGQLVTQVVKLPAGGGPQVPLTFSGLEPEGVAVDGAGNVFVSTSVAGQVVELPAGSTSQVTLPTFKGVTVAPTTFAISVGVDNAGDVFLADPPPNRVVELPFGCHSATCEINIPSPAAGMQAVPSGGIALLPHGVLAPVDGVGNAYYLSCPPDICTYGGDNGLALELPVGGGAPITIGNNLSYDLTTLAVDPGADLFISYFYTGVGESRRSSSGPLNFGEVTLGTTATLPLTITNTGTGTLTITPSIDSPNYRILTPLQSTCTAGMTNSKTCTLQIEFSPSAGPQNGVLTLQTNAVTAPTVLVGLQGFVAALSTPVLSLPSGVYPAAQTVSITDTGSPSAAIYYTTNGATPTAASTLYTGPISVTSTERVTAIAIMDGLSSTIATAAYAIVSNPGKVLNFSQGFANAKGPMQFNGTTHLDGSALTLTDDYYDQFKAGSAFYTTPVNIQSFATYFTFQLTGVADGITFTIQNVGPAAVGDYGESLGYAPIGKSVAIKFDLHDNAGEGPNSTGLYLDGALPTIPSINLTGTGIDLHSGNAILAQITYDGTTLNLTLTDTVTLASWSHAFTINIPSVIGGNTAYLGFTGATGVSTAGQQILSWTYVAGSPVQSVPPPPDASPVPDYWAGFYPVDMTLNGNARFTDSGYSILALALTGSPFGASSAYYSVPVNIQSFTTDFTFQMVNPSADGFTFAIQNAGPRALGGYGEALGYAPIDKSLAVKFDLHDNAGEGPNSTGLYVDGALPTVPAIDLTGTGIDLHSGTGIGDIFLVHIAYNGTDLDLTIHDTNTGVAWSHSFAIDIPATVGGNTAYVGFTGATGAEIADETILTWTFSNP
jgi:hypothetical protein